MLRYHYTHPDPRYYKYAKENLVDPNAKLLSQCIEVSGITWNLYVDKEDMKKLLSDLPEFSYVDKTFYLLWAEDPRLDPIIGYMLDREEKRRYVFLP